MPEGDQTLGESKNCPFCAETIKKDAVVCRFCGYDLRTGQRSAPPRVVPIREPGCTIFLVLLLILIGIAVFVFVCNVAVWNHSKGEKETSFFTSSGFRTRHQLRGMGSAGDGLCRDSGAQPRRHAGRAPASSAGLCVGRMTVDRPAKRQTATFEHDKDDKKRVPSEMQSDEAGRIREARLR